MPLLPALARVLNGGLLASTVHDSAVAGELEKIHATRITQGRLAVTCAHVDSSDVKPCSGCDTDYVDGHEFRAIGILVATISDRDDNGSAFPDPLYR